jgi:hypothetical protein
MAFMACYRDSFTFLCNIVQTCLLIFCKKKIKNQNIQNYNFACVSVWVQNLVSDIKGGTETEGVWEQGADENIWTEEVWTDERLEKTAWREAS